ncbi:hypothetical protein FS837_000509 [Tulasnella sp. UAMH 9824]|nr:hypothetical protein FS837_000509 [Tulasnella sp. UAMH 9824]
MFAPAMNTFGRILTTDRLSELGRMYQSRGEYERAFRFFVRALEDSRQWDNTGQLLSSLRDLAQMHRFRKEYREAIALHSEFWEIYAESMEQDFGNGCDTLRDLAELQGLLNGYKELYSDGREIRQEELIAKALCKLARQYRLKNQDDEAVSLYSEAVEISTRNDDKKGRASALRGLADVHRNRKEFDEAIRLYSEVLEIRTDLGERKGRASALRNLASVHRHRGEYDEAIRLYSAVLDIWTELNNSKGRASALWALAGLHRHGDECNKAILLYREVLKIRTDLGDNEGGAAALSRIADVYRDQNRWGDALCLYNQVAEIAEQVGDRRVLFDAVMDAAGVSQLLQQHAGGGRRSSGGTRTLE